MPCEIFYSFAKDLSEHFTDSKKFLNVVLVYRIWFDLSRISDQFIKHIEKPVSQLKPDVCLSRYLNSL